LDKIKPPPGVVVVVVDEVKEALSLLPKMVLMAPEEYQKLVDRLAFLEKQNKSEKKTAHACKMTCRLEGDFAFLRAEFAFTTDQPGTVVVLGMQGAHLTDEGELDRQVPLLDIGDEGLLVKVDKEGTHQLVLNLKVPVSFKRPATAGGGSERGFDLSLPGAAVTTLALDLPAGVKEVRWNDNTEKPRLANHWELALGKLKTLNLSWKEPVSLPGTAPLLAADSQITVKVEENVVLLSADITLEDLRGQTKEWQLGLPDNALVEVKVPAGLAVEVISPEGKRPYHLIRLAEASSDRLLVNVQVRYTSPFPAQRLAIGPFAVMGTYRQEGILTVNVSPNALRGQRLLFHRDGEIYPRDIPKGPLSADTAAIFKFWNGLGVDRSSKGTASQTSLELEFQPVKIPTEVGVAHSLQIKPRERFWLIDVSTILQIKSNPEYLDIQLPRFQVPRFGLFDVSFGAYYPATLSWLSLAPFSGQNIPVAVPLAFSCADDGWKLGPSDAQGRARLTWNRSASSEIKLTGKYLVPAGADHLRIDLPRPLDVVDRGGNVKIKVNEHFELLIGTSGSQIPAPDKHEAQVSVDTFPESLEVAWKAYRPEFPVTVLADFWIHDSLVEGKQQLNFIVPPSPKRAGLSLPVQLRLHVPSTIRELTVVSGGKLILHDPSKESAWILPSAEPLARAEIQLRYDFPLPAKEERGPQDLKRLVQIPLVELDKSTHDEIKVRIWSENGVKPLLVGNPAAENCWRDFGLEIVPGSEVLPALVLQGTGPCPPLTLQLIESADTRLASFISPRGLIYVAIDDEGTQSYRARYFVTKLNSRHLDLELPMPAVDCLVGVWLDKHKIHDWESLGPGPNIVQIPVQPKLYEQPIVLEIEYKLPAHFIENQQFWRTMLMPPRFRGEVFLGQTRWQVEYPFSWVALVPGGNMEYRWGIQGWLPAPEPSLTSAELESWLTEHPPIDSSTPVSMAFSQTGQDNVKLLHFPRQMWLLTCSGILLALGLALFVVPLSRTVFWLAAAFVGMALAGIALIWPEWVPAVAFGCQPGALVLVLVLGIQWLLKESYRRRLVFMPGFARVKGNSSLIRHGNVGNRREPSTIDAPGPVAATAPPTSQVANKEN